MPLRPQRVLVLVCVLLFLTTLIFGWIGQDAMFKRMFWVTFAAFLIVICFGACAMLIRLALDLGSLIWIGLTFLFVKRTKDPTSPKGSD